MSKKFAIVHPDKTVTIKMPDVIFDMFTRGIEMGFIQVKFTDTPKGLRGNSFDTIIVDELIDEKGLEKLLTNLPTKSTIKTNQGSNLPGKE